MKRVPQTLLERLHELSLLDVDAVASTADPHAAELIGAYVADLEEALGEARRALRDAHAELGAGPDPLLVVEQPPERRVAAAEQGVRDAADKLGARAAGRREIARLEELVVRVLPRLLEADRRLVALAPR
jgi:hypothetical protein